MTDYSNISPAIGELHWQNSITHDNGQFASDGGGKSSLVLGQPGKGKTTLLCYIAQMSRCIPVGGKSDLIRDLLEKNPLNQYAGKVFQETVLWRARDMDSFANILYENWQRSLKGTVGATKRACVWVHELDKHIVFFSHNHKRQPVCIENFPPPRFYKDAEDLLKKLEWGMINIVLEPQTYHLGPGLIQKLREKKMDISEEDDRARERAALKRNDPHRPGGAHRKRKIPTSYEKREVSPSYFWFEMIHVAKSQNHDRHIHFVLDEVDDIFEARSEGDVWKLIEMLANDWKDLRKHNISTSLSTHEIDFIDWRILPRIDYIIWMTGARLHARSAIKVQPLVSNLPIGKFLIEQRGITFGQNEFHKIPLAQPAVRIDGLKGEDPIIDDKTAYAIMEKYAEMWGVIREKEVIDLGPASEEQKIEV